MLNHKKDSLKKEIQQKRQELIKLGTKMGLQDNKTLLVSQELDQLILEFQKL